MMKVAYVTLPLRDRKGLCNLGDRVIFNGVRNRMRIAIGPHCEAVHFISDADLLPADVDIVVVCGMPQVSQSQAGNAKIERLAEVARSKVSVRLNLGAGSFFFDGFGNDREKKDASFAERVKLSGAAETYRAFAKFDLCTCRDLGAVAALRGLGMDAIGLPCPGFFAAMFQPQPLFRRQEELVSVLNGTASFWNRVDADVHSFYRRLWESDPTRIFLAHDEQDAEMLSDMGIPHVVFDSVEAFLAYLARHERLLSVRVHGALPAWTLGLDVTLLGIDRRALIGEDFGARFRVISLREETDFAAIESGELGARERQGDDFRRDWLWQYASEYVRRIREVVSRKLGCEFPEGFAIEAGVDGTVGRPCATPLPSHRDGLQPTISRPRGKYFSKFFYCDESEFTVEPKLLRSAHRIEYSEDQVRIEVSSSNSTLMYGPYVRLPKGRWRVRVKLEIELSGEEAEQERSIVLRIVKGIPARELARLERKVAGQPNEPLEYEVEFANESDTGSIETIFTCQPALTVGTRVRCFRIELRLVG